MLRSIIEFFILKLNDMYRLLVKKSSEKLIVF